MSRNHRTGQPSAKDMKALLQMQIAQQMYEKLEEAEYKYMSRRGTILTYFCQYASVQLEDFIDHFEGNNCTFTNQLRNKARVAMKACDDFMKYFEPLIHPDNKEDWNNDYFQLQYALDNWFNHDSNVRYQKGSDAERAKEICRAAALRYHDPMETNLQRTFEAGFREGAAYADLHPIDSITITITDNGVTKQVTLKELAEAYTGKSDIIIELNAKRK